LQGTEEFPAARPSGDTARRTSRAGCATSPPACTRRPLRGYRHDCRARRRKTMTYSSPTALLNVDRQPGKPPILLADAAGDPARWVAEHRDALRSFVAEHGSLLVRGLPLR